MTRQEDNKGKKKRKVMREFVIDEISAVDKPAQEGAKALLMKSADGDDLEKRALLLSETDGHTHLLDDTGMDNHTSYEKAPDDEYGHSHPWVRDDSGNIVIGTVDGHTHTIASTSKAANPGSQQPNATEQHMNETEKAALKAAEDRAKSLEGELAKAKAIGSLTDAEKAHFAKLAPKEQDEFLAKSAEQRGQDLQKSADGNAVIYTSADGLEFRKSDDPRLIEMAKRADADRKLAREAQQAVVDQTFGKRAETELSHLPGEQPVKVALLKALETISDEATRKGALELLKANNTAMQAAFAKAGTTAAPAAGATANDQLEVLAKKYSIDNKVDILKARVAVLDTPEGAALYEQSQAR